MPYLSPLEYIWGFDIGMLYTPNRPTLLTENCLAIDMEWFAMGFHW